MVGDVDERVLLVEDDSSIREVASLGLDGAGLRVVTAANGREALARFRADPYDLVVLDVMLPEVDGLAMIKEMKANPRTRAIPVIIITAKDSPRDVIDGINSGAKHYITKPFKGVQVLEKVKKTIGA